MCDLSFRVSVPFAPSIGSGTVEEILNEINDEWGLPCGSAGKESTCNAGDLGSIPGLGRSPGEGNGPGAENPSQGTWEPGALRVALNLGGQATAGGALQLPFPSL